MNVLVYGFGLMGKKVAHAVRQHEKMNLVGVVSPIFDEDVQNLSFLNFPAILLSTIKSTWM